MTDQETAAVQRLVAALKAQEARITQLERDNASLQAANRLLIETHPQYAAPKKVRK